MSKIHDPDSEIRPPLGVSIWDFRAEFETPLVVDGFGIEGTFPMKRMIALEIRQDPS
jgi:hypothetical protein